MSSSGVIRVIAGQMSIFSSLSDTEIVVQSGRHRTKAQRRVVKQRRCGSLSQLALHVVLQYIQIRGFALRCLKQRLAAVPACRPVYTLTSH